jgi:probable rRNA maturation factor
MVRKLNLQYRGIDSTTDVLSFPIHEFGGRPVLYRRAAREAASAPAGVLLLGDVVIDPARAAKQASEIGHPLGDEIMRLVVHGIFHLLGYEHENSSGERRRMRRAERALALSLGSD